MDILDLFGEAPPKKESYLGDVWLFKTTGGVRGTGVLHATVEAAEEALRDYTHLPALQFDSKVVQNGVTHLASKMYQQRRDVAVVVGLESGDVFSTAPLPEDLTRDGADLFCRTR